MKLTTAETNIINRLYRAAVEALDSGIAPKRVIRTTRDAILEWRLREPESESVSTRSQQPAATPEQTQTTEEKSNE